MTFNNDIHECSPLMLQHDKTTQLKECFSIQVDEIVDLLTHPKLGIGTIFAKKKKIAGKFYK